jgi:hypothetical protein
LGRSLVRDFFRQIALRFDEQTFFHNAFVFFERTLDPVYVIAVSIGHLRIDPIIAMALGAEKQIRNPGHHFTNAELAHAPSPESRSLRRVSVPCDKSKEKGRLFLGALDFPVESLASEENVVRGTDRRASQAHA